MRTSSFPDCALLLVILSGVALVHAQFEDDFGPAPPRLLISGAVPLGPAPRRPLGRLRAVQGPPNPDSAPRPRARPSGRRLPGPPIPAQQSAPVAPFFAPSPPLLQQRPLIHQQQEPFIPPRPVIEDADDEFDDDFSSSSLPSFSPTPNPSTPQPTPPPPQRTIPVFRPERPAFRPETRPALLPTPAPELNFVSPSRQQLRPSVFKSAEEEEEREEEEEEPARRKPAYNRGDNLRNKARPTVAAPEEAQQYSRQPQAQYNRAQSVLRAPQKQTYTSGKQQDYEKPIRQHQRPRKPVAQVLRRFREDNADGSITWGFENDDGSFKEETIGTDCVTYGKYGYIDPEGTRREYSYSTGVPCDKNKADSEEQPSEGYVDYAENKYVLPNGDSVDLDKMVKNRARRPVSNKQYRSTNN